jgi:pimeloyl-ACP methyl ester carboxylesterase
VTSATVVLVHGAWHGDWCWDLLIKQLGAAGLDVATVDNPSVQSSTASLQDDADNVRALLDEIGGPVVLVGHSYGGGVISDAGTP